MYRLLTMTWDFLTDPLGIHEMRKEQSGFNSRIHREAVKIVGKLDDLSKSHMTLDELHEEYIKKLAKAEEKAEIYCLSLNAFGDVVNDMAWMKWVNGEYAWVNHKIISDLLFTKTVSNTLGRTDVQIGADAVRKFGENSHDFGAYCAGSDGLVIANKKEMRFLEYGLSGGKPLVLDVVKTPVFNKQCEVIATTGVARDVTNKIFTLIDISQTTTDKSTKDALEVLINEQIYLGDKPKSTLFDFYNTVKSKV